MSSSRGLVPSCVHYFPLLPRRVGNSYMILYYYVPKLTYYYCTIHNNIPTPIYHHTHLYIPIHPYTTPYTPIQHHIPLYKNSYTSPYPGFRSALQWTVFRSGNTEIFRLNPTLFLVTFEIKL